MRAPVLSTSPTDTFTDARSLSRRSDHHANQRNPSLLRNGEAVIEEADPRRDLVNSRTVDRETRIDLLSVVCRAIAALRVKAPPRVR
jgi:hypothetical protein